MNVVTRYNLAKARLLAVEFPDLVILQDEAALRGDTYFTRQTAVQVRVANLAVYGLEIVRLYRLQHDPHIFLSAVTRCVDLRHTAVDHERPSGEQAIDDTGHALFFARDHATRHQHRVTFLDRHQRMIAIR